MQPTAEQLANRLNPTATTVNIPKEGQIFRQTGDTYGTNIWQVKNGKLENLGGTKAIANAKLRAADGTIYNAGDVLHSDDHGVTVIDGSRPTYATTKVSARDYYDQQNGAGAFDKLPEFNMGDIQQQIDPATGLLKGVDTGSVTINDTPNAISPDASKPPVVTPPPASTPTPTATPGQTYTVKSGDTVSAIAAKYGVPISDVSGYRSGSANLIYPGEVLTIGKATTPTAPVTQPSNTSSPGSYKGVAITGGTDAEIQAQIAKIDAGGATSGNQTQSEADKIKAQIDKINADANSSQNTDLSSIKDSLGSGSVTTSDSSKIIKSLVDSVTSADSAPKPPSFAELYATNRANLGVGALETQNSNLDASIAKLDSEWKTTQDTETNRQVSVTQINRRKSAEQIKYEAARADLVNQKNTVVNQLNQKYAVIDNLMKYTQQDYTNAVSDYTTKFNQAITLTNLIKGVDETAKTDEEKKIDNARANLQVMLTTIKGKDFSTLDPSTQADIKNMEIQAGLPTGFFKFVSSAVSDPVVTIGAEYTDASGYRQVPIYTKNPDTGVMSVKVMTLGSGKSDNTSTSKDEANDIASAILDFQKQIQDKGWVGINPQAYDYYKSQILSQYGADAVLKYDKAIADAGLSVDYTNK